MRVAAAYQWQLVVWCWSWFRPERLLPTRAGGTIAAGPVAWRAATLAALLTLTALARPTVTPAESPTPPRRAGHSRGCWGDGFRLAWPSWAEADLLGDAVARAFAWRSGFLRARLRRHHREHRRRAGQTPECYAVTGWLARNRTRLAQDRRQR